MKKFLMLIVLAILIMSCSDNKKENWIQLFNGKDFTGWNIKITGSALKG